jgi:hypothetical protein
MRCCAKGAEVEMGATLEAYPLRLTTVREYASSVIHGSS